MSTNHRFQLFADTPCNFRDHVQVQCVGHTSEIKITPCHTPLNMQFDYMDITQTLIDRGRNCLLARNKSLLLNFESKHTLHC